MLPMYYSISSISKYSFIFELYLTSLLIFILMGDIDKDAPI